MDLSITMVYKRFNKYMTWENKYRKRNYFSRFYNYEQSIICPEYSISQKKKKKKKIEDKEEIKKKKKKKKGWQCFKNASNNKEI